MPEYLELTLENTLISGYSMGSASAAPIAPATGLADFSIEQPVERADDAPTDTVSFAFGEIKVVYPGNSTSGGGQGAGKVVVADTMFVANAPMSADDIIAGSGNDSLPQDGPISFDAYDNGFLGGVRVPTSAGQAAESGHEKWIEVESMTWGTRTGAAEGEPEPSGLMETMQKAWKDASFDPVEFFTADDSAAAGPADAPVGPAGGDVGVAEVDEYIKYSSTDLGENKTEPGLVYSGESGGLNEAQTGHYVQSYSWGLDRIDQRADAAGPFFAYDAGFLGGVNVGASESDAGFGGGVFVAAGDLDGVRPHVFGEFELM